MTILCGKGKSLSFLMGASIWLFFLLEEPAFANSPLLWGALAGGAQLVIGLSTAGVGLILVTCAEAWVFSKELGMKFTYALGGTVALNIVSSIMGAFLAAFAYSSSFAVLIFGLPGTIIFAWLADRQGMPRYYGPIIFIGLIAGTFGIYALQDIITIANPFIAYLYMLFPLVLGFALTLIYESLFVKSFLKHKNPWKALLKANLYSYLILAILIPFSPVKLSLDSTWTYRNQLDNLIAQGGDPADAVGAMNRYHGSNLYLIGLTKEVSYPAIYDASDEIGPLKRGSLSAYMSIEKCNPEVGIAIAEELLRQDSLTDDAEKRVNYALTYYTYWNDFNYAAKNQDVDEAQRVLDEWTEWITNSKWPDLFTSPLSLAKSTDQAYNLGLDIPEESEIPEEEPIPDPFGVLGGEDDVSTSQ